MRSLSLSLILVSVMAFAEEKAEAETETESGIPNWLLWTGLALGNTLVMGLGYVAFRMVRGKKLSAVLDDESADNADIQFDQDAAGRNDKTKDLLAELAGSDAAIQLDEPGSRKSADTGIIDIADDANTDDPFAELLGKTDDK